MVSKLQKLRGSAISFVVAASFVAGAAGAQNAEPEPATAVPGNTTDSGPRLEEVVVTGSSIRGVAPIGSNVVTVDEQTIKSTGAVNMSQLVNTIPAITTSGAAPQGENVYSYYSPQIHSLAGSASNSTLVIADGLRLPGGGTQYSQTDPNIIPTSAIQRVEVLADGASSVYGSDAVAGVVNFIIRKSYDGLELNAQHGFGDDYDDQTASMLWGTRWDTGSVMIAAQYSNQSRLGNDSRDFLSMGDYRPLGGSNMNAYNCSPATIKAPAGSGPVYLSPGATTPVANTADNAPCNTSIYGSVVPEQTRRNVLIRVSHDFGDRLTATGTFVYNNQKTSKPGTPGAINNVTVYGAGSGKNGQINPFFVAPAGNPGATSEQISWLNLLSDDYGTNNSEEDVSYGTFVADYKLTDRWTATFSDAVGRNTSSLASNGVFCAPCAYLALNGTAQVTASTTASNVTNQNVISLNMPLTPANSLDVWSVPGSNQTSASVIRSLYGQNTSNTNLNTFNQAKLAVEGPLFSLPAGEVRLAVGGEYLTADLTQTLIGSNNTGPSNTGSSQRIYRYTRDVSSAYAELVVPLVSQDMDIPLVENVDVDISGRYDKYSDVGSTSNPKFAVNWTLGGGVTLRANYSTSFVAPPLAVIGDPGQGYLYASGSVGLQQTTFFVPVANYPEVVGVPGCATATVTCAVGLSGNPGLRRQLGGGFSNIKPQTGDGWSVGLDFVPDYVPGLVANVTLFNNKFKGGVNSPNPNSIVNSAGLHDHLTICPSGCTPEQIATFANSANGVTISGAVPANVYFLLDQNSGNVLNLDVQGIDFMASYRYDTQRFGTFQVGDSVTYFTRFDQNFGGGTSFSVLNTSGYNTTFPSVQTQNRFSLGWQKNALAANAYVNYTGSYHNWSNTSVNPVLTDSIGNPVGGGDKVDSNLTVDLHVAYDFDIGMLKGAQVYLDGKNIFDQEPPFYNGNTSGILGGAAGFNGFVSNPIGRVVSVGVRADF